MRTLKLTLAATAIFVGGVVVASAQTAERTVSSMNSKAGCTTGAAPATPQGGSSASSGTAPGDMGSTGWSGGTGGSHIGTTPHGSTDAGQGQSPVATGVDLNGPPTNPGAKGSGGAESESAGSTPGGAGGTHGASPSQGC